MEYGKFIMLGDDKKTLAGIKNALIANGHIFIGYSKEMMNMLRYVRSCSPDLIVIDVGNRFKEICKAIEYIDEEVLAACILIFDTRNKEMLDYIGKSKVVTYLVKPVFDEALLQIVDISMINFRRVLGYEDKVRKLNDTLESRKIIEKAKWILVEKEGYTEAEAYETIKKKSRDNRMPMREISEAIILTRG